MSCHISLGGVLYVYSVSAFLASKYLELNNHQTTQSFLRKNLSHSPKKLYQSGTTIMIGQTSKKTKALKLPQRIKRQHSQTQPPSQPWKKSAPLNKYLNSSVLFKLSVLFPTPPFNGLEFLIISSFLHKYLIVV